MAHTARHHQSAMGKAGATQIKAPAFFTEHKTL